MKNYLDIPMFVSVFVDATSDEGGLTVTEIQRVPGGLMVNGFFIDRKSVEYDMRIETDLERTADIITPEVRPMPGETLYE